MHLSRAALALAVIGLPAAAALAHNPVTSRGQAQWAGLLGAVLLLAAWGLYLRGLRHHPARVVHVLIFHVAALVCALALFGPLDDWAKTSTAAHMVQHMLLMVVIAPLWVLARPLPQMHAALGPAGPPILRPLLWLAARPLTAAYLHGAVIWFWHTPYFYMLAVDNPWWHALEHACFLLTACAFWWAALNASHRNAAWSLLAVLFTLMHTGFLGAVLTFASAPLYGEARDLADQQLAGLVMWVIGGIPYLLASGWIAHRWYGQLRRRMEGA